MNKSLVLIILLIVTVTPVFADIEVVEVGGRVGNKMIGLRDGEKILEVCKTKSKPNVALIIFYRADKPIVQILRESTGGTTITYQKSDVHEVTVSLDENGRPNLIYLLDERGNVLDGAMTKNGVLTPIDLEGEAVKNEKRGRKRPTSENKKEKGKPVRSP